MGLIIRVLLVTIAAAASVHAELPRIAVISIDFDEFAPDSAMLDAVRQELSSSGRFQVADLGDDSFLQTRPDSLLESLRVLAADNDIDVFMAIEILAPEVNDRTVYRNDSLVTVREVSVDALGRFYSSEGNLIGTLRNTVSRQGTVPIVQDTESMAELSCRELAARSILEVFPMEVTFTASDEQVFQVPLGRINGIRKGTTMAVLAVTSGIPDDPAEYEMLRSRGLIQIMDVGENSSSARLLSGRLVDGGTVTALEQSAPAIIYLEYVGSLLSVEKGTGLGPDEDLWSSGVRLGVETGRWGLSFGGGINAGTLQHASNIGVELLAGTRLPLHSPSLTLRLSAGGELSFLMQDVRADYISSSATAFAVSALANATLEYLFSDHLGLQVGVDGAFGTVADSWTVQEYTGQVRDAEPDEIYYTSLKRGPVGVHAGLTYFMF